SRSATPALNVLPTTSRCSGSSLRTPNDGCSLQSGTASGAAWTTGFPSARRNASTNSPRSTSSTSGRIPCTNCFEPMSKQKSSPGSPEIDPRDLRIYRLKITLGDTDPPIWRRLEVYAGMEMDNLATALDTVFGWSG